MEAHAKQYSQGYRADLKNKTSYTFWSKAFDEMAKKTMLRQLISKYGIMSTEIQTAYEGDMAYIKEDGSKEYIDNEDFDITTPIQEAEIKVEEETGEVIEEPKKEKKLEAKPLSLDDVE